jgi:hypothetical protein
VLAAGADVSRGATLEAVVAAYPHLAWPRDLHYFHGFESHDGELPFPMCVRAISAIVSDLRHQQASPWMRPTWQATSALYAVLFGEYGLDDFVEWLMRGPRPGQVDVAQLLPGIGGTRAPLGGDVVWARGAVPAGGPRSEGVVIGDPANPHDWRCSGSRAPAALLDEPGWTLCDVPVPRGYSGAAAVEGAEASLRVLPWSPLQGVARGRQRLTARR